ncbi:IS66 family insertion sequence element accessory protein TnpA [Maridesulfovibrio sp.]|uniref:IS66 family insertion sequence element accessory protein TnpA n=1 Tax=Maridesulfovibrio sp. TaxID=2795000 RepID=UPI002A188644|nr:hypothetical protein [Maridesulfovibrio sp.]
MAKASRKQKKLRSADFWRKHVDGWRASKLTQAEYCRRHKLSAGAFYHWKRRFLGQSEGFRVKTPDIVAIPVQQITAKEVQQLFTLAFRQGCRGAGA